MRALGRLKGNPVARRVALREEAVAGFEGKVEEFADGARENVRMLDLLERELHALEEEVYALVEVALEDGRTEEGPQDPDPDPDLDPGAG